MPLRSPIRFGSFFAQVVAQAGPRPVLIEWDADVPDWAVLQAEAARAGAVMAAS